MSNPNSCHHCEGLGYIEIRDCSGEIQREQTCFFCDGVGYIEQKEEEPSTQLDCHHEFGVLKDTPSDNRFAYSELLVRQGL